MSKHLTPLPEAVAAPRQRFTTKHGERVAWYGDSSGEGRPLVLVHSVNAAPSTFEVKPIFEHYQGKRPVYSLDLPGFGHSERSPGPYSAERYAGAIMDFLEQVVQQRCDLLALSLGAEFATRAARWDSERIASLVLVSPTGFFERQPAGPKVGRVMHRILTLPGLGPFLFALVSSKPSIRYYLGKSFAGPVPQEVLDYAHATSHQPGAQHAPLMFLSMQLFTPDAPERLYDKLPGDMPVLAIADRDPYVGFERLPEFVAAHPSWRLESLAPHMGLPQWERRDAMTTLLDGFWASLD